MWPFLWENPVNNFLEAYKNMSVFRWNDYVLYMGNYTRASELPWHYGLVYMFITTPVLYVILFSSWYICFCITALVSKIINIDDYLKDKKVVIVKMKR